MIRALDKKVARERLFLSASEAEIRQAQLDLVNTNRAMELALDKFQKAEEESINAFEVAKDYLSLENLCPMRVYNLHREIETKRSSMEQYETDYEMCVENAKRAVDVFTKKKAQSNTFHKRLGLANQSKAFTIGKIEDGKATELYTMRTGSEK